MTGFKGRVGAYEVAAVTDVLAEAVRQRKSEAEIETLSRQGGFRSMFEDGLLKARMGMTTMAEAGRVAGASGS